VASVPSSEATVDALGFSAEGALDGEACIAAGTTGAVGAAAAAAAVSSSAASAIACSTSIAATPAAVAAPEPSVAEASRACRPVVPANKNKKDHVSQILKPSCDCHVPWHTDFKCEACAKISVVLDAVS